MNTTKKIALIISSITLCYFLIQYTKFIYKKGYSDCELAKKDEINSLLFTRELNKNKKVIKAPNILIQANNNSSTTIDSLIRKGHSERRVGDLFLYSFLIANEHKSLEGAYQVFNVLSLLDTKNIDKDVPSLDLLDEQTRIMAIKYLQMASEDGGPINAKYILGQYYSKGIYLKQDSIEGKKLLSEAYKLSGGVFK